MTILDFYADWCNPCKSLAPVLDKVASERGIEVVKVNIEDDEEELSVRHGVRNIPTVVVLNDDGSEKSRFVGTKSESDINKFFDDIK
jgi:thioredoxin